MKELLVEIPKILSKTMIWLGGPEVTYHSVEMLEAYPMVRGIMKGEGEETFVQLLHAWNGEVAIMIWMESRIGKRQPARSGITRIRRPWI